MYETALLEGIMNDSITTILHLLWMRDSIYKVVSGTWS